MSRSIEDQGSSPLIQPVVEPFQRFIHTEFGAVLIIAFFYTSTISWVSLEVGGAFLVALICANILGIRHQILRRAIARSLPSDNSAARDQNAYDSDSDL